MRATVVITAVVVATAVIGLPEPCGVVYAVALAVVIPLARRSARRP